MAIFHKVAFTNLHIGSIVECLTPLRGEALTKFACWLLSRNGKFWAMLKTARPLRQRNKNRPSVYRLQVSCSVSFALHIFHKQYVASSKNSFFTKRCFYLDLAVQQNNKLSLRRRVEIVIIRRLYFPK